MSTASTVSHDPAAVDPGGKSSTPAGAGVVRRTTRTATRIALVVIGVLVGLFAAVNTREVAVSWVFGDPLQTPLILVIAVSLAAGLMLGWLGAAVRHRGH